MDSVSKLGVDKTCVWKRDTAEYQIEFNQDSWIYLDGSRFNASYFPSPSRYSISDRKGNYVNFERLYLGYCGQTYKIFIKYGEYYVFGDKYIQPKEVFFNPTDEEIDRIEGKKHKPKRYKEKKVEQPFNLNVFQKFNCPIFLVREQNRQDGKFLITNLVLKDLDFFKIKDAYICYQEIYQFISGVLGNSTKNRLKCLIKIDYFSMDLTKNLVFDIR